MTGNSTLDPDNQPPAPTAKSREGNATRKFGPSDSSDTGADLEGPGTDRQIGDVGMDAGSDRSGTGERMAAGNEPVDREDADIEPDRIVDESEAGLGGGLDQAEEAQRGKTRYGKDAEAPKGKR